MNKFVIALAIAMPALALPNVSSAKGCLKGAAVGGVAGHVAGHHGVIGAAAGCAIGRHRANAKDKAVAEKNMEPAPAPAAPSTTPRAR